MIDEADMQLWDLWAAAIDIPEKQQGYNEFSDAKEITEDVLVSTTPLVIR